MSQMNSELPMTWSITAMKSKISLSCYDHSCACWIRYSVPSNHWMWSRSSGSCWCCTLSSFLEEWKLICSKEQTSWDRSVSRLYRNMMSILATSMMTGNARRSVLNRRWIPWTARFGCLLRISRKWTMCCLKGMMWSEPYLKEGI